MLANLKLSGLLEAIDAILSETDGGTLTPAEAIARLLDAQITLRNNRRLQTAMRSSRLPVMKTLADFDFSFQPSLKREQCDGRSDGKSHRSRAFLPAHQPALRPHLHRAHVEQVL
jgi:DNA replication protein DnaC